MTRPVDLLLASGFKLPPEIDAAFELTQYAVTTRYPGAWESVTDSEVERALQMATNVLAWVAEQIGD